MGITILDMAGGNPHSRIGTSPYGSVAGVRHWLREHLSTGGAMPGAESVEGELEHICDAEDVCVAGKPESVERIRGAQKMIVLSEDDSDERVKKPEEPLESGVEKMPIESSEKDVGALLVEESKRDVMAAAVAESTVTVSGERSVAAKAAEEVAASLVSKADEAASLIAKEESSGKRFPRGAKAAVLQLVSDNSTDSVDHPFGFSNRRPRTGGSLLRRGATAGATRRLGGLTPGSSVAPSPTPSVSSLSPRANLSPRTPSARRS
ncbi:unnamed protein product, partial [Cyprideis torosa]